MEGGGGQAVEPEEGIQHAMLRMDLKKKTLRGNVSVTRNFFLCVSWLRVRMCLSLVVGVVVGGVQLCDRRAMKANWTDESFHR